MGKQVTASEISLPHKPIWVCLLAYSFRIARIPSKDHGRSRAGSLDHGPPCVEGRRGSGTIAKELRFNCLHRCAGCAAATRAMLILLHRACLLLNRTTQGAQHTGSAHACQNEAKASSLIDQRSPRNDTSEGYFYPPSPEEFALRPDTSLSF